MPNSCKFDVTIIVVSYNTRELTFQCLKSVFAETRVASFEVIVVDNASEDGSAQMIAEHFPHIIIIANKVEPRLRGCKQPSTQNRQRTLCATLKLGYHCTRRSDRQVR